jgi:hypothetical protein
MLGKEHPSTLTGTNNLAAVLRDQGKDEQTEEMYRQELRLCKTALGQDHPSTLTSTSNLTRICYDAVSYERTSHNGARASSL